MQAPPAAYPCRLATLLRTRPQHANNLPTRHLQFPPFPMPFPLHSSFPIPSWSCPYSTPTATFCLVQRLLQQRASSTNNNVHYHLHTARSRPHQLSGMVFCSSSFQKAKGSFSYHVSLLPHVMSAIFNSTPMLLTQPLCHRIIKLALCFGYKSHEPKVQNGGWSTKGVIVREKRVWLFQVGHERETKREKKSWLSRIQKKKKRKEQRE